MDVEEFKTEFQREFRSVVRAVSELDPFDFHAVIQFPDEESKKGVVVLMWPTPYKDFRLVITDVEKKDDEWIITTPKQRWAWRKVDPTKIDEYRKHMQKSGVDVA